jgi:hypothetical protein
MAAAWKGRLTRNDVISFAEAAGTDFGAGARGGCNWAARWRARLKSAARGSGGDAQPDDALRVAEEGQGPKP